MGRGSRAVATERFTMSEVFLYDDAERATEVHIHPVVIISILDHYVRRSEEQNRVIGTLLGVREANGVVQVRDCFPVPHVEGQDVAVDMRFHQNMFSLHGRASAKAQIVGWYSTGNVVDENTALIHNDFYWGEVGGSPIHLSVDTAREDGNPGDATGDVLVHAGEADDGGLPHAPAQAADKGYREGWCRGVVAQQGPVTRRGIHRIAG